MRDTVPPSSALPLNCDQVQSLIDHHFPGIRAQGHHLVIESVGERTAMCVLKPTPSSIRPGGTISGPAMFTLADFAVYVALIATLGEPAIPAVTSNLNITFLRRPPPEAIRAEAEVIRLGRRLAYAEVRMRSQGETEMIAHATASYAPGSRS